VTTVVVGWRCWCSGVNDKASTICHICGTGKPVTPELVTEEALESSKYEANLELVRQLQRAFFHLRDGLYYFQHCHFQRFFLTRFVYQRLSRSFCRL